MLDAYADKQWAELQDTPLEFTITRENYEDELTGTIFENKELTALLKEHSISPIPKDFLGGRVGIVNKEGTKTLSIYNYYLQQYRQTIRYKDQPLLIAESRTNNKKLLKSEEDKNKNENVIYLVPELVLITGIENEAGSKSRRQDIISKTKTNPSQRMNEINKIHYLMNSDIPRLYKKNGEIINSKSSKQLAEEWGINLGENLNLEGRILNQPKLIFDNKKEVIPRNGLFRSEAAYDGVSITRDNISPFR